MPRVRLLAPLLLLASAGCLSDVHTFHLELTRPDGTRSSHALTDRTSWENDSLGNSFASWPDIANWGTSVDLGVLVELFPMQPGTYDTGGSLDIGADMDNDFRNAARATIRLRMDAVEWTGSRNFPFVQRGRLEGTTSQGHAFSGSFTTSTDDCDDNVGTEELVCGRPLSPDLSATQRWTVAGWSVGEACPAALASKFSGGTDVTIDARRFEGAGSVAVACTPTYENRYEVICGASETRVAYDGCDWSVAVFAVPAYDETGSTPFYRVLAGTVGDACEPKFCQVDPTGWTRIR